MWSFIMTNLSITQAREHLSDLADKVAFRGERLCVKRNGKPVFAMVSIEDMKLLEAIEEKIDIEEAEKALRRNKFTSWNHAKKKLGL
jgi:prevent-host-death family protein